jgi:hypothetical protein
MNFGMKGIKAGRKGQRCPFTNGFLKQYGSLHSIFNLYSIIYVPLSSFLFPKILPQQFRLSFSYQIHDFFV